MMKDLRLIWGVSNRWTGIWNGMVEWTMEWTMETIVTGFPHLQFIVRSMEVTVLHKCVSDQKLPAEKV